MLDSSPVRTMAGRLQSRHRVLALTVPMTLVDILDLNILGWPTLFD